MEIGGIGAVVTGGGSGLGEATARALAARGASVCIVDLGRSKGAEVAAALGGRSFFAEADVASADAMSAAIDAAVDRFSEIRVAVNCAGIGLAAKILDKDARPLDLGRFSKCVEVNLVGTFNVIRLAAARMVRNEPDAGGERGVIVNTASIAAFEGQVGQAAYAASKGGVVAMTLPVARELARDGIRCVTIAPGLFRTPMLEGLPAPALEALGRSVPFPARLGEPAEYAALACHIVENAMLNGEVIRLDGAIRMAAK